MLIQLAEPLLAAAEAHNQLGVQQLLQLCRQGAEVEQQAQHLAAALKESYYDMTAELRELQEATVCWGQVVHALLAALASLQQHLCTASGPRTGSRCR